MSGHCASVIQPSLLFSGIFSRMLNHGVHGHSRVISGWSLLSLGMRNTPRGSPRRRSCICHRVAAVFAWSLVPRWRQSDVPVGHQSIWSSLGPDKFCLEGKLGECHQKSRGSPHCCQIFGIAHCAHWRGELVCLHNYFWWYCSWNI